MANRDEAAWPDLLAEADAAFAGSGSNWGRYGLPHDAVEFRSAEEAVQPAPDLAADEIRADMLETITALDDAIRGAGALPEPFPAWIGLELPPEAGGFPFPLEVGRHICLTGFVSATLAPGPALFAAGLDGALLHVRLAAALPMKGELEKPSETELLPPRNTCYVIDAVHEDVVITDEHGRLWTRSVVQATQMPMETQRRPARSGTFTAPAARRWREMGPERQALFLGNVWCVTCGAETTMVEPSGRIERGDLVLQGTCRRCGGEVARVIEGG